MNITKHTCIRGTKQDLIDYFNNLTTFNENIPQTNVYYELDDASVADQINQMIKINKFNDGKSLDSFGIVFLLYKYETNMTIEKFYIHIKED